ncbi:hypothetical protein FF011L_39620 [Roseimaritima multifibrata]|uniref:Uncharacterized protein n=1 Tax=Roseimaritima multifibrata TaxID=1930274 RepID=A0A517MJV1_9BACT|nr:hypothetical protein FF011L_39620 [Roseimaritima multifibrata]
MRRRKVLGDEGRALTCWHDLGRNQVAFQNAKGDNHSINSPLAVLTDCSNRAEGSRPAAKHFPYNRAACAAPVSFWESCVF